MSLSQVRRMVLHKKRLEQATAENQPQQRGCRGCGELNWHRRRCQYHRGASNGLYAVLDDEREAESQQGQCNCAATRHMRGDGTHDTRCPLYEPDEMLEIAGQQGEVPPTIYVSFSYSSANPPVVWTERHFDADIKYRQVKTCVWRLVDLTWKAECGLTTRYAPYHDMRHCFGCGGQMEVK